MLIPGLVIPFAEGVRALLVLAGRTWLLVFRAGWRFDRTFGCWFSSSESTNIPPLDSPPPIDHLRTALAGETEDRLGAEGATAPETLRQKDRDGLRHAGKRRP